MTMEIWGHWVIDHLIRTLVSDGYLAAGDDEDDEHQEQEPEHVVELVFIYSGEDEEELYEASTKRQNPSHEGTDDRVHVPYLATHLKIFLNQTVCLLWLGYPWCRLDVVLNLILDVYLNVVCVIHDFVIDVIFDGPVLVLR